MNFRRIVFSALLLVTCALRAGAQQTGEQNTETKRSGATTLRSPDVVYVPTPMDVVEAMLRVTKAGKGDVVYDLGSGDGRIPIMAVQKFNVDRAIGIDINPDRIREAELNASTAGVSNRVRFSNEDLFEAKIGEATVVTLYLLSTLNLKLLPKLLEELKPGTRVVSHAFDMGGWKPRQALQVNGSSVYFWVIPAKGTAEYKAAVAAAAKATSG